MFIHWITWNYVNLDILTVLHPMDIISFHTLLLLSSSFYWHLFSLGIIFTIADLTTLYVLIVLVTLYLF